MKTKSLDASAYIASPERAVALLNKVIASGGDLDAIKQAVGVVAVALERDFSVRAGQPRGSRHRPQP